MSEVKSGSSPLSALSRDIVRLAEGSARSVISLNVRGGFPTSGTVWEDGYLVVADHVLHGEQGIVATFDDGSEKAAEIVGRDPATDIALLASETGNREFSETVDSAALRPGMLALALSRNSERSLNASLAVLNAVGGEWRTSAGSAVDNYLRIDVPSYAGFSGGPLIDTEGALIGIDNSRLSRHSAVAVPVSTVSRVVAELKEHGRIRRGYLGVATFPVDVDESLRGRLRIEGSGGLMIVQVEPGSGADRGGVLQGDILLAINGVPLRDPEDLVAALGPDTVGKSVPASVVRGGGLEELSVEVGERPAPSGFHHRSSHRHRRGR